MKFAVAVKGPNVSKDTECCDTFLIFEEKNGNIIMRQIIENPGQKSDLLPGFLDKFKIEAILCGDMDEQTMHEFAEKGISAITGTSGNADRIAEQFAETMKKQPI